ncbi:hypothetical protein P3T76_004100 [Phytophthora citrophthora]|uniref:Cas12f1-like TNB domain-containing protein n=1 Tax=Phytophthora citrophthora TaxID=4793 RepID=A0AAD9GTY2_9STRA|nr:hypothetical protein P3T76_004100 [Phytophthora citrophthora]
MRGQKRLPPDKPGFEDEIVAETPPELYELGPPSPPASPPRKRVKRQDLVDRKAKNKTIDFFVMKETLRVFCKPEATGLAWNECIQEVNQAVAEAFLLANLYVLRQLKDGRPLCKIDATDLYQPCLSLVTSVPRREKFEKVLKTQETKDRRRRWEANGRTGKLEDVSVSAFLFTEDKFQQWLTTQKTKNKDLEEAADEFCKLRGDRSRPNTKYLNSGWFQAAASQMATNAKNGVVRNFAKRLRTYVLDKFEVSKSVGHEILNGVFAQTFNSVPVRVADPVIVELREKIPRTQEGKISWAPQHLLPMFYEFLQYIEKWNKENKDKRDFVEKRVFSLLPTKRGFESSYCKVDSTGLRSLLLRSPNVRRDLTVEYEEEVWTLKDSLAAKSSWIKLSDMWWRRLFYVDKLEKPGVRSFHREITTDGYGVGVHMNRPTRGKKKKKKKRGKDGKTMATKKKNVSDALGLPLAKTPTGTTEDYDVIWGIDPGRTDFITATNQDGKTVRFRTSDFYRASGYSRSNRKSKHRIDKSPGTRELLKSTPSKKTASVELFCVAIEFWFEHGRRLLSFFMDPFFRKLKFRRYTLRSSQLDRACFELAGARGTKTIVGFGDCGMAGEGVIKGSVPGPVKTFARKLARYCEVVVVDEFRTSKRHYDCHSFSDLENQRVKRRCRDGVVRSVPVHKVLHCLTKNGGCGKSVDRDVNAAKNILSVLQNQLAGVAERPLRLQRTPKSQPRNVNPQPIHPRVVPFTWNSHH